MADRYEWKPGTDCEPESVLVYADVYDVVRRENVRLSLRLDDACYEYFFCAERGGKLYASDTFSGCAVIERYIPRQEWPAKVVACFSDGDTEGMQGPDRAILKAISEMEAKLIELEKKTIEEDLVEWMMSEL